MSSDIINFDQKQVMVVNDKEGIEIITNPIYTPILRVLRDGIKTAEEIREDIENRIEELGKSQKPPSIKTIYRHLKFLTDAGFVVQAGVRNYEKREKLPSSMKLYARAARFYFYNIDSNVLGKEKMKQRTKIITSLLRLSTNEPKISEECIEKLVQTIWESRYNENKKIEKLFIDFPKEMVEALSDVPFENISELLADFKLFSTIIKNSHLEKKLKECLEQ